MKGCARAMRIGAAALATLLVSACDRPSPMDLARDDARRELESCWKEQQRKSLSPSIQRAIAARCEQLQADLAAGRVSPREGVKLIPRSP